MSGVYDPLGYTKASVSDTKKSKAFYGGSFDELGHKTE